MEETKKENKKEDEVEELFENPLKEDEVEELFKDPLTVGVLDKVKEAMGLLNPKSSKLVAHAVESAKEILRKNPELLKEKAKDVAKAEVKSEEEE